MSLKFLIAAGGTGGHINPGVAIAKHIKENLRNSKILFVGTEKGLEKDLVPRAGFTLRFINVKGFARKLSLDSLVTAATLIKGMFQARKIIKEFKPDVVIGTGGYVCGPVVLYAALCKIPTVIHEQNALPGITNRLLSRFANVTAAGFEESFRYFPKAKKFVVTGNPIRNEILQADRKTARESKGIKEGKPLIIVAGGSGGAENINNAVADMLIQHYKASDFQMIFATGPTRYEKVIKKIKENKPEILQMNNISILPYIYDMENTMAATDIMVTRGGAITISELTALGVASIIIPSPNVTDNHQEYNARQLEKQNAALVILEKDLNGKTLYDNIMNLLFDNKELTKMRENAKNMGIHDATQRIFDQISELLGLSK